MLRVREEKFCLLDKFAQRHENVRSSACRRQGRNTWCATSSNNISSKMFLELSVMPRLIKEEGAEAVGKTRFLSEKGISGKNYKFI